MKYLQLKLLQKRRKPRRVTVRGIYTDSPRAQHVNTIYRDSHNVVLHIGRFARPRRVTLTPFAAYWIRDFLNKYLDPSFSEADWQHKAEIVDIKTRLSIAIRA